MITFTKEQLIASAHARIEFAEMMLSGELEPLKERTWSIELELARIALASLEAEPVAYIIQDADARSRGEKGILRYFANISDEDINEYQITVNPLYTSPPAPVSVPEPIKRNDADGWWVYKGRRVGGGCAEWYNRALEDYRAAMPHGAEPVTTDYKLPANTPCKDAPEHIWLQTAGVWPENGEFSELTWCSDNQHPDDTLYVRADVVPGNSPVNQDGWVACSERMPEREVDVQVYCSDKKEQMVGYMERNERNGYFRFASLPNGGGVYCQPTHWMPLPAAPQQEVKP